jgi:hypothetical protein
MLARSEVPSLHSVALRADGTLEGLEKGPTDAAAISITAQLLALLIVFIGTPLTERMVGEIWPDAIRDG